MPPLQIDQELELLADARLQNHETPFFYTSKDVLKKNYDLFTGLFDNSEIYYALKANSDPKVLTYLDSLGCGFEAASGYEVSILLDLGVEPTKIVYGTSIKPASHIKQCFEAGVHRFAADSREEIEKLAANAPGSKIYIRTIVDDAGSVFMMSERFGATADTVKDLVLYAKHLGLKTYGISFYVGSQATRVDMWSRGIRRVRPIIEELYEEGVMLEALNIGGGFPVRYDNHKQPPKLHDIVVSTHNALHTLPYMPKIIMEPGRGIVASSTVLVAEVIARNDRAGKPWLCLDAGIYNALYESMIHQGATGFPVYPLNPPTEEFATMKFTLAGPTGDSLDIIARDIELPAYTNVGDRLLFENAGAYSIAMASRFNGFPTPKLYIG
ncbi:MAG: type III PLP-dependent enzyme [Candidatus Saccharimonadales bacterium]